MFKASKRSEKWKKKKKKKNLNGQIDLFQERSTVLNLVWFCRAERVLSKYMPG
jgi:hypothetical protein